MKKVKGGKITTEVERQDLIEDGKAETVMILTYVTIYNLGDSEINIVINNGDDIPLEAGEGLSFGELKISSLKVVEVGSTVKFMGIC